MKLFSASFSKLYQIVGCINSILNESINDGSVVIQSGFDDLLDYPVIRIDNKSQYDVPELTNYDFYVTYLGEMTFETFLNTLRKQKYFNPKAGYIFLGEKPDSSTISFLLNEFLLNLVILELETKQIFTVFPYHTKKLDDFSTKLQNIGSCKDERLCLHQSNCLFPNKIPPVWKRSNLTLIYSYEAPYSMTTTGQKKGIEMDLVQLILEKIDMDAEYIDKRNPVYDTLFLLVKRGRYDIRFGNVALTLQTLRDSTLPYSCDSAFWYVPQTEPIPKWKLVMCVFSLGVNVSILLSVCFICLLWDVSQVFLKNKHLGQSFFDKFWRIIMIVLEQGIKFKLDYATPSILVFLLLQAFLVLNSLCKAKYTFFLSGTNFEKSVETLDEAMERDLKLGSTKFMIGVYKTTPKVWDYLEDNFVECDTGPACMNRSASKRDLAVLKPYRKVAYIRDTFRDHHGYYQHHRLLSPVFTLCNSFVFPEGHPLFSLFNRYVHLTIQHGFVQKIMANYDQILTQKQRAITDKNPRLKIDAVKGPLFLILIGILIGFAVLAMEISFHGRKDLSHKNGFVGTDIREDRHRC